MEKTPPIIKKRTYTHLLKELCGKTQVQAQSGDTAAYPCMEALELCYQEDPFYSVTCCIAILDFRTSVSPK